MCVPSFNPLMGTQSLDTRAFPGEFLGNAAGERGLKFAGTAAQEASPQIQE